MRKIFSIALVIAGLSHGAALAEDLDAQSPGDNRIKMLMYDEADVYTITTRYGYQTNIVFAPNEEIETISVGDRSVWQIIPAGNRMFIRPMEQDVITNMTVLTNKHSYQFDLKSNPAGKDEGNIYVAKFVYKDEKKKPPVITQAAPPPAVDDPTPKQPYVLVPSPFNYAPSVEQGSPDARAQAAAQPSSAVPMEKASATNPNYNYTYSGSDELAPLQVYDDGKATYIKYRSMPDPLPTVSVIDPSGNEASANTTVKDDYILVDTVTAELSLKSKENIVHIFNENTGSK